MARLTTAERWLAEGRCVSCGAGKMPPEIDWTGQRCPDCAAANVKRTLAWNRRNRRKKRFLDALSQERSTAKARAAGLCVRCGDPAEPSTRPDKPFKDRCAECRRYAATLQKERDTKKRAVTPP
jgi:hypothetical protein